MAVKRSGSLPRYNYLVWLIHTFPRNFSFGDELLDHAGEAGEDAIFSHDFEDVTQRQADFKGLVKPMGPIGPGRRKSTSPGPTHVQREKLINAKTLEDVLTVWRKGSQTSE